MFHHCLLVAISAENQKWQRTSE